MKTQDYVSDPVLFHLDSTRTYYNRFEQNVNSSASSSSYIVYPESLLGSQQRSKIDLGLEERVHCIYVIFSLEAHNPIRHKTDIHTTVSKYHRIEHALVHSNGQLKCVE